MPVLAVYAGRATDAVLADILPSRAEANEAPYLNLPRAAPASLLAQYGRPAIVNLSTIVPQAPVTAPLAATPAVDETEESVAEVPATEQTEPPAEEDAQSARVDEPQSAIETREQAPASRAVDAVTLLPWRGPFEWSGLIVASRPPSVGLEALDPYREPLARLTDRLAAALEFQRGDEANEACDQRASRITDFARSLIPCLEEKSPMDAIVREVTTLVGSDSAALWRVDDASGMVRMTAAHGLKSPEFLPLPMGQGLAGSVAQTGEALSTQDAPADPRCIFPREARESGVVSYLGAPLSADGRTLGVIEAHNASSRAWTESDLKALESAAAIISELAKSTDSRGDRLRVESAYLGLSESLQRLRSPDEIKEAVVEVLGHALSASRVIVVEFNDQDRPEPVRQEYRQPSEKSALGAAFAEALFTAVGASQSSQPMAIVDSGRDSLAGSETARELGVRSEIAAPIRFEGKTRGIVYIHQCDRVREWRPDEIEFAERVVRQLSLSLSNLRSLESALNEAEQARADAQRAREIASEAPARIRELEGKLEGVERELAQSRTAEEQARGMLAKASTLEAKARAEADVSRRVETEVRQQLDRAQQEQKQAQGSAQQLLEINRLKSEFIVNAGHEMEASLQSVLGLAELLERGSYGALTPEQREAVHGIYGWARRIKNDIDWLVEYGSARSRRLDPSSDQRPI